jgi:ankyrin repeat protein
MEVEMKTLVSALALLVGSNVLLAARTTAAGDPLFDAVAAGDKVAVEQALTKGSSVDGRASDHATPLIAAALDNQLAITELLLGKGANVMARNSGGFTPLHAAAYAGSVPIAKLLLDKGAALDDAANKAGVTPLMVAGEQNHVKLAEFFLAEGANVGHPEIHGYLPITRALWKGNKDIVRLYKRHGATCPSTEILGGEDWYRQCVEIGQ